MIEHSKAALKTLQEMLQTDNKENPWLGVTSAVALLQIKTSELETERDALQLTLTEVEENVAEVYCYITNQQISKCNTDAQTVIAVADDCFSETQKEIIAENEKLEGKVKDLKTRCARLEAVAEAAEALCVALARSMSAKTRPSEQITSR